MNRTAIPTLLGVFTSLLAIWVLHLFIVVDSCTEQAGNFHYDTGECILDNGEIFEPLLGNYIIILYFVVGFSVSFLVSTLIKKVFKMN